MRQSPNTQRIVLAGTGFSLLELMVAMAIGLLITALLITIYSRTAATSAEFQRTNSQIENGRYALQLLQQELMHAGFWGEFIPSTAAPSATIDPCAAWATWGATANAAVNATNKANVLGLPVVGYNADSGTNVTVPTLPAACATPLSNRVDGTDVLVVRHAQTCIAGVGDCENAANDKLYLQTSLCATQSPELVFGRVSDTVTFDRTQKDCATVAGKRKFLSYIYYVRKSDDDEPPVLARSEFDAQSGAVIARTAETLVEDIENLQVEYLLDTTGDGIGDGAYLKTCLTCLVDDAAWAVWWSQVVAVRLYVVARSSTTSPGYNDSKTYNLGSGAGSWTPPNADKGYKRHVFSIVVRLVNPASRKAN